MAKRPRPHPHGLHHRPPRRPPVRQPARPLILSTTFPLPLPSLLSHPRENRHFDRSCSQLHREQRSGEIRFSTSTVDQPTPRSLLLHPLSVQKELGAPSSARIFAPKVGHREAIRSHHTAPSASSSNKQVIA
jgi:hypothetical protein